MEWVWAGWDVQRILNSSPYITVSHDSSRCFRQMYTNVTILRGQNTIHHKCWVRTSKNTAFSKCRQIDPTFNPTSSDPCELERLWWKSISTKRVYDIYLMIPKAPYLQVALRKAALSGVAQNRTPSKAPLKIHSKPWTTPIYNVQTSLSGHDLEVHPHGRAPNRNALNMRCPGCKIPWMDFLADLPFFCYVFFTTFSRFFTVFQGLWSRSGVELTFFSRFVHVCFLRILTWVLDIPFNRCYREAAQRNQNQKLNHGWGQKGSYWARMFQGLWRSIQLILNMHIWGSFLHIWGSFNSESERPAKTRSQKHKVYSFSWLRYQVCHGQTARFVDMS